ncbi:hypothetical protein BDV34DRAFT_206361 [Aspergillus parasiticus]|uniref:Secreted protein n=1 Tax=Aspergillus parasiticus TaxID=5067 RepID=A0A5N6D5X5_ASPPA|nr:hypothetical protein BDV34DRAFT_206361 [Aspergillus parasiticus]
MFIILFFFQTSSRLWGQIPKWRTGRCSAGPARLAGESILPFTRRVHWPSMQLRCTQSCSQLSQWEECHPLSGLSVTPQPMGWRGRMVFTHFSLFFLEVPPVTTLRGRHPTPIYFC